MSKHTANGVIVVVDDGEYGEDVLIGEQKISNGMSGAVRSEGIKKSARTTIALP